MTQAQCTRDAGLEEYDRGHYATAAVHFRRAADLGDAHAAQTLSYMYRYGERLYGDAFPHDEVEASRFAARAAVLRGDATAVSMQQAGGGAQ